MFENLYARLTVMVATLFVTPENLVPARIRRGAGFMEYALLAALAVGIFLLLTRLFPGLFEGIINRIRTALGWSA